LAACDGLVVYALDALREAYFSEQVSRLILVEYRALMRAPGDTMRLLYAMLEEPLFEHDDNVEYQFDDFDMALSARGLRSVRRKVEWVERRSVLPPGLFERFSNDMFWRLPEANIRNMPTVQFGGLYQVT
jgi:sulfotransferase